MLLYYWFLLVSRGCKAAFRPKPKYKARIPAPFFLNLALCLVAYFANRATKSKVIIAVQVGIKYLLLLTRQKKKPFYGQHTKTFF